MATSGITTFNQTRDQIISDALQLIGYLAAGETAAANDVTFCANLLEKLTKSWQSQGLHMFTEEEATLFLVNGQAKYLLEASGTGSANASINTTVVETTLNGAGSGSSITVTSSTGMTVSDNIGIQMDAAGTTASAIFWTTITVISGNTITLNAPMTRSGSTGNQVFSYTTQLERVLSIQSARCRDSGGFDRWMKIVGRDDYMRIPQKTLTGQPIILYMSPQIGDNEVYVWPTPSDVSQRIKFTYIRSIQDFNASGNNPDFPQEWLQALTTNLAVRIAPGYGINLAAGGISGNPGLVTQAAQDLEDLKAWDCAQPYVQFVPGWDYRS